MGDLHLPVIPAKAGIRWLQVLGDPCFRRDDGEEAFFDTLVGGNPLASWRSLGGGENVPLEPFFENPASNGSLP
jgi:hypothetical protein